MSMWDQRTSPKHQRGSNACLALAFRAGQGTLLVLVALLTGCGGSSGPTLFPVAGRVLVGTKPVPAGTVQFRADTARGNKSVHVPAGTIRPDGGYELHTDGRPGAPAGWYRVIVMADNFSAADPPPGPHWPKMPPGHPKPLVHERYLSEQQTDVRVEVVENPAEGAYVLRLKP